MLIRFGGITYALREDAADFAWQAETAGPPTLVSRLSDDAPQLSAARLTVPSAGGIAALDPSDGTVRHDLRRPGARARAAGSGRTATASSSPADRRSLYR